MQDQKWIDLILGKSESVILKQNIQIAFDESKSDEQRNAAFDEIESLVENMDNANGEIESLFCDLALACSSIAKVCVPVFHSSHLLIILLISFLDQIFTP